MQILEEIHTYTFNRFSVIFFITRRALLIPLDQFYLNSLGMRFAEPINLRDIDVIILVKNI